MFTVLNTPPTKDNGVMKKTLSMVSCSKFLAHSPTMMPRRPKIVDTITTQNRNSPDPVHRGHAEQRADDQDAQRGGHGAQNNHRQRADNHLHIGQRRNQSLLDVAQEALKINLRGGLQECRVDDVHHQDAGQHEFEIASGRGSP